MNSTDLPPADPARQNPFLFLRRMAETYLREQKNTPPFAPHEALSSNQVQGIISELQTHQLELEMQNEELRRTQVELENARSRYFDLYDLAPVGYCTVTENGRILETNLAAADLFGVARGILPNQPFSRFILKEDQDIFYLLSKQLFSTGESQSGELRIIRRDGILFWVNLESTLGVNASGMTVSRVALSNITKRKAAEGDLQKSHRQNQAILDSITDAFISVTDEMIISYFNTAAEQMFNRKRSEVIGRKLFDVLPEGKDAIFEDKYSQAIRHKSPMAFEAEFNVASLQNWYGVRVYPSAEGMTIYLQVITERKKAEEEKAKLRLVKRQLQKAESLERMAGAIAHLFNNHLQVALGNLEMALDSLAADAAPREYLLNAIQANRRSSEVSGLLLTYLGQKIGKLDSIDLVDLCQQNLPGIAAAMLSHISLETHYLSPGLIVRANASQMEQVLTILLTNAMEAVTGSIGKVTVVVKAVPASLVPTSHVSHIEWVTTSEMFTCLEVTDTGCGMGKEEMGKIFDPFYTTRSTGRGLGLAVAMSLVRAWGGMIHVQSEVQKGSCFSVFLPLDTDRAPALQTRWRKKTPARQKALCCWLTMTPYCAR